MLTLLGDFSIQLLLSLAAAAVFFPFVYMRRRVANSDRQRLRVNGQRGQGMVLEVWRDAEGLNVTYEFTPKGQVEKVTRTETFEGAAETPVTVGAYIEIAYETKSPFYSVPLLPSSRVSSGPTASAS